VSGSRSQCALDFVVTAPPGRGDDEYDSNPSGNGNCLCCGTDLAHLWEGLAAVYQQAQSLLKRYEVSRISTRGTRFDPAYHEAVGRAHGAPDGMIVEEVKAGYAIGDTVLRPAQVVVAVQEAPRRSPHGI
jgi:hypothetical protein